MANLNDTVLHIRVFLRDSLAFVGLMCCAIQNLWKDESVEHGFCRYLIKDFLKWLYNGDCYFNTPSVLCLVFTRLKLNAFLPLLK